MLVFRHAWIDSDRSKHILIRIVADLAEIVSSTSPKLASVRLKLIVHQEERVVLATSHFLNHHIVQRVLNLSWLDNSVSICIPKTQLALIRISTAENFVTHGHKDRVPAASLNVLDRFASKGLHTEQLRLVHVL